jgi:hypothetical protein
MTVEAEALEPGMAQACRMIEARIEGADRPAWVEGPSSDYDMGYEAGFMAGLQAALSALQAAD